MGWWKSAVGPSSLCLAQKIMKNDVSYMGVKKLLVKLELAKYYKDSEMTAFISERSRNFKIVEEV